MKELQRTLEFEKISDLERDFQSISRVITSKETNYATHNMHDYPAKFIPQFPRVFIENFSKENEWVLDPMVGAGTTLIEACLSNRKCCGIDIDPVACLISQVSINPVGEDGYLRKMNKVFMGKITDLINNTNLSTIPLPKESDFPNIKLWFIEDVAKELIIIRDVIQGIEDDEYRNFLTLCLSAIVRKVSNADPRDIFPQRDKNKLIRERKDVLEELRIILEKNTRKLLSFSRDTDNEKRGVVIQGDARAIPLPDKSIDLVFTSPPYSYAMDYARIHQLSTFLFFMSNRHFKEYRRKYIGTDRVSAKFDLGDFEGFEFAEKEIKQIFKKDKKIGLVLYKYFEDMAKVTEEMYRVLRRDKYLIYVVGNSTIMKTNFRVVEVFCGLCENSGFKIEQILERPYFSYRMPRVRNIQSNTIKSDIFIIARK
jgi:DNA modification methylase